MGPPFALKRCIGLGTQRFGRVESVPEVHLSSRNPVVERVGRETELWKVSLGVFVSAIEPIEAIEQPETVTVLEEMTFPLLMNRTSSAVDCLHHDHARAVPLPIGRP